MAKSIYRVVIQPLEKTKWNPHGRTNTNLPVFVEGRRYTQTQYGVVKLIPQKNRKGYLDELTALVRQSPDSKITYTIYDNGESRSRVEELAVIN